MTYLAEYTRRFKANCSGANSVTYCKHATRNDYAPVRLIRYKGMQELIKNTLHATNFVKWDNLSNF